MEYYQNKKGLTFIEILISMSIIMILFATFFYIWNTLDIFRTARDNKRINDLNLLDSAIKTILAINPEINLGQENLIYTSLPDSSSTCGSYNLVKVLSPYSYRCQNSANYLRIDGNGWLPLDFRLGQIIGVSVLPIDPLNNQDYFYAYQVKGNRYKLTAKFESKKYLSKMLNDGGFEPTLYEVGSNLRIPSPHSGLVGYWNFDETGSTAYDLSGYNNHGTMYSSTIITDLHSTSSCKIGYCSSFDGVDDYVEIQDSINLRPVNFTIIFWLKGVKTSDWQRIMGKNLYSTLKRGWVILWHNTQNIYLTGFDSNSVEQRIGEFVPITNNELSFVGFVKNNDRGISYKNGELIGTTFFPGWNFEPSVEPLRFGRAYVTSYFQGTIDEVRIYNRALSADEIKALYEATK